MSISIIIPTFNRASLIPRAIDSVINQKYSEWELIIVDDGSTDNTKEIMDKYLIDSRIKYFKKSNSGAAHSRNVGVEQSTYNLITFLDSDDEAVPNWLSLITHPFTNEKVEIACCGLTKYDVDGSVIFNKQPANLGPSFNHYVGRFTNGGVFALRKRAFEAIGGYDKDLKSGQHTELGLRLTKYLKKEGLEIASITDSLVKIHVHNGPRIRFNHLSLYEGSKRTFDKHEVILKKDKKLYRDYLCSIVFNGLKADRVSEVKKYLNYLKAEYPLFLKSWFYQFKYYKALISK